jgi:Na+/H+ antiporter NhaD/arsenite permease-like protein
MNFNLESLLRTYAYFIPLFVVLAVVIVCLPFFIREFVRVSRYNLEQARKRDHTFQEARSIRSFANMIAAAVVLDILLGLFSTFNASPDAAQSNFDFFLVMIAANILFLFVPVFGLLLIWCVKRRIKVLERHHQ